MSQYEILNELHEMLIYIYNIEGMSQYEILNELHEMLMVPNVYKNNNNTNHQIVNVIITGFTSQLK